MRVLRKEESYAHTKGLGAIPEQDINKGLQSSIDLTQVSDATIEKYADMLEMIAKEYSTKDFEHFNPTNVIHNFWVKYNWANTDRLNLFDVILLAKQAVQKGSPKAKSLDLFLKDFLDYMIASHTLHYLNRSQSSLGRYRSAEEVKQVKEGTRINFVSRLLGLVQ